MIALIEDEPRIRVPLAKALSEAGYQVVSAASGFEGRDLLATHDVDVAVIDLRLPGRLDGVALAGEARRQHPHLPIIFVSGAPPDDDAIKDGRFLQKPFTDEELLQEIRACLASA